MVQRNRISVTIIPITAGVPPITDAAIVYPFSEICSPVTSPRAFTASIAATPCKALRKKQEKKRFVLNAETIIIRQAIATDAITPNLSIPDNFITSGIYMRQNHKKCRQTAFATCLHFIFKDLRKTQVFSATEFRVYNQSSLNGLRL